MPSKLSTRVSRLEKIVEKHEERLEKLEDSMDTVNKQLQDMRTRIEDMKTQMTKQDKDTAEIKANVKALWNFIKYFVAPALTGLIGLAIANLFT